MSATRCTHQWIAVKWTTTDIGLVPNKLFCTQCGVTRDEHVDLKKHRVRGSAFSPMIVIVGAACLLNLLGFLR